jgi:6-phosphofructokinase 2
MIYTITLNPALDHYLEVEDFFMDDANRVRAEALYAGGKGIDVSRAVRHLGGDSIALGFIGGHNGQVMVDLLQREGVNCHFTPIRQETRRDIIVHAAKRRGQTLLHSRGPVVTRNEWRCFLAHLRALDLRGSYVVVGGSLPSGLPVEAYREVIALAQSHGAKAVLDADGACLREGLKAKPFATKPNVHELRRVIRRPLRREADLTAAAAMVQRAGVKIVLVSRGAKGLLATTGRDCYRAIPPAVTVKSRVGAGDSAVAGFVLKHAGGKSLEECVRFATAAGTAATLAPGNQLCRLRDVQRLLPKVKVEKLGER